MQKLFNLDDFFSELGELYNKEPKNAYVNRISKLFKNVSNNKLDAIFDTVTELHEASTTLPTVNEMRKAIEINSKTQYLGTSTQARLSNTDNCPLDKIIEKLKLLKKKDNTKLKWQEIDFLCDWDLLWYCYSFLQDKEWEDKKIYEYLQPLLPRIIAGENVLKSNREDEVDLIRSGKTVSFQEIKDQIEGGIR